MCDLLICASDDGSGPCRLRAAKPYPVAAHTIRYRRSGGVTVAAGGITDTDVSDPPDSMDADVTFAFTTANPAPPGAAGVIINEVDADTPGSDTA